MHLGHTPKWQIASAIRKNTLLVLVVYMSLGRVSGLFLRGPLPLSFVRAGVCTSVARKPPPGCWETTGGRRELSYVPVDDRISGLTGDQIQVQI